MKILLGDKQWAASVALVPTMTTGTFLRAYASHYVVPLYVLLFLLSGWISLSIADHGYQIFGSFVIVALVYPVIEFGLHKYVLHGPLYRMKATARLWRRLHYDHHMNPSDRSVLFGAPQTTIPAVIIPAIILGYPAFGLPGIAASTCAGFLALLNYELFHCAAHLPVNFNSKLLKAMRRHHSLHHFHSEKGNYGIVTSLFDQAVGTKYDLAAQTPPSPTVRNLGYTGEEVKKYPSVAELDQGAGTPGP